MRVVQNIPHELVIHAQPIAKLACLKCGIPQFFSDLRLNSPHGILERSAPQMVRYQQNVNAAVIVLIEDAGGNNELQSPASREFAHKFVSFDKTGVNEESAELPQVRKRRIERPSAGFFSHSVHFGAVLSREPSHTCSPLNEPPLAERGYFVPCDRERCLCPLCDAFQIKRCLGVKEEQAHNAHL